MNQIACETEKISSRTVGLIALPFALALGFLGALVLPLVGLFFSIPLFLFSFALMAAPEPSACKVLLKREV
jgi:MFS superfamily sulfate permease-like transporter